MPEEEIDTSYLRVTCRFCPTQAEGDAPDGRHVYFRYRWGVALVEIDGKTVWGEQVGDSYDGVMDADLALNLAAAVAAERDSLIRAYTAQARTEARQS